VHTSLHICNTYQVLHTHTPHAPAGDPACIYSYSPPPLATPPALPRARLAFPSVQLSLPCPPQKLPHPFVEYRHSQGLDAHCMLRQHRHGEAPARNASTCSLEQHHYQRPCGCTCSAKKDMQEEERTALTVPSSSYQEQPLKQQPLLKAVGDAPCTQCCQERSGSQTAMLANARPLQWAMQAGLSHHHQ
jgi:hypothetical protein